MLTYLTIMKRLLLVYFYSLIASLIIVLNGNFIIKTFESDYKKIFESYFENNLDFNQYYNIKFNEYSIYNMENIIENAKLYHNTFVDEMFAF